MVSVCLTGSRSGVVTRVVLAALLAAGSGACIVRGDDGGPGEGYELQVLSSRPDMITGGNALVGVGVPPGADLSALQVTRDGRDVTGAFRPAAAGGLVGLVDGLSGTAELALATADGTALATLSLVNHPLAGPVFSGPHEQPFICETDAFELVSGETLGPALDDACSIARRVDYAYRSTADGELKPLADPRLRPADLAATTTLTAAEVPYIVRIETGTINRAIYQIAMLHDPAGRRRAGPVDAARRLERPAHLHLRRRLRAGLVPAGAAHGRGDGRRDAQPGLRRGVGQPQRLRQQLQTTCWRPRP